VKATQTLRPAPHEGDECDPTRLRDYEIPGLESPATLL
jgi:hypothetical protein